MTPSPGNFSSTHRITASSIVVGILTSVMLLVGVTPAVASLANNVLVGDRWAHETLAMTQSDATDTVLCESISSSSGPASCAQVDLYGGRQAMKVGETTGTTIRLTNSGTVTATDLTVTGGACTSTRIDGPRRTPSDLCDHLRVVLQAADHTVFVGTAAEFADAGSINVLRAAGLRSLASGESVLVSVSVTFTKDLHSHDAGGRLSQPITWTFNQ